MAYVFSRSTDSVKPDYGGIAQSGATLALNSEDPHLAQALADARAAGAKVAIWIPAHQGQDATAYGRNMAALVQKYKPDAILPNIEGAQGKASSGGTQWSQNMMNSFQQYVQPGSVHLDVVTEPGEKDFNYRPYLNFGGGVVNEAFTGDMKFKDPDVMRQQLIDAGVPPDRINMLLAPGQKPGANTGGNFSAYTWDDMKPAEQQAFLQAYRQGGYNRNVTAPTTTPTRYTGAPTDYGPPTQFTNYARMAQQRALQTVGNAVTTPNPQTGGTQVPRPNPELVGGQNQFTQIHPENAGFVRPVQRGYTQGGFTQMGPLPDASNPAAQAYSRSRLAQHGITVRRGEDAAAMWRAYSAKLATARAVALAAGPTAPNDVLSVGRGSRPLSVNPAFTTPATPLPPGAGTPVPPGQWDYNQLPALPHLPLATSRSGPVRF